MNRSARTAETVSDVYLALMLSAFLLWTGPDGYTKILEAKYRLFFLLTIVYCAAAALSALRQIRTVCFCKLLRAGHLSIAEVAVSVGFFDQFYFSRVFKRAKGVPPSKYFAAQQGADPADPAQL